MNNSKYDIVTVIGVSVSVIAIILLLYFKPGMVKVSEVPQSVPEVQAPVAVTDTGEAVPAAAETVVEAKEELRNYEVPGAETPWKKGSGQEVEISAGEDSTGFISADGAGFQKIRLNNYKRSKSVKEDEQGGQVELSGSDYPFLALVAPTGSSVLGEVEEGSAVTTPTSYAVSRKSADGSLRFTETWNMSGSYEVAYSVRVENLTEREVSLAGYRLEGGVMPVSVTPNRKASRGEAAGGATVGRGNEGKSENFAVKALAKMKPGKKEELFRTPASWTAVHSKYFLLGMWMKEGSFAGVECAAVQGQKDAKGNPELRHHVRAVMPVMTIGKGGTGTWEVTGYAGPKMYELLCSYDKGVETVMEMDRFFFWRPAWMKYLSRGLLRMLVWISSRFPASLGYGFAVIILTLLVKILFWPLSHKSTVSMRRMQALKPQLDELKAKYKDDPSTMYRKQQELFKANNVSQLGGCLPMLLQIPVFFALFNTFRNAIELRHAGFFWVYDLSMPDTLSFSPESLPIRPLALLMGAAMYFQQKMTPNPDPQQAKMMSYMTVFFIFLFYGMPSALTLYLTVSYLLGIAQTMLTNKLIPPVASSTIDVKAKVR